MKATSCCYANAIANVLWFLCMQADGMDQNVYKVNCVKVTGVETRIQMRSKVRVSSARFIRFRSRCGGQVVRRHKRLLRKNLEVKVAWKGRNKTSRGCASGTIWFLTSKDPPLLLTTLDPTYPQNPGSLCFHSGPRLSEPHIYGPCLITVSTCCFTSLR